MRSPYHCRPADTIDRCLRNWYQGTLGQLLLQEEQRVLNSVLANLFGYHLLQCGYLETDALFSESRISHRVLLLKDASAAGKHLSVCGEPEYLPFASESLDLVLLHHSLNFEQEPHRILREADRVLIPDGYLVIVGFNPWSMFGLRRALLGWLGYTPWCGRFLPLWRLKEWLSVLGFEVIDTRKMFYRPPISQATIQDKLSFLEQAGNRVWPFFGGVYVLVARKCVIPLTPIRKRWQLKKRLLPTGATEPTTRSSQHNTHD
jgi:SAM-dependent methyltransferase